MRHQEDSLAKIREMQKRTYGRLRLFCMCESGEKRNSRGMVGGEAFPLDPTPVANVTRVTQFYFPLSRSCSPFPSFSFSSSLTRSPRAGACYLQHPLLDIGIVAMLLAVGGVVVVLLAAYYFVLRKPSGRNPFETDSRRPVSALEHDLKVRNKRLKQGYRKDLVPDAIDAIVIGTEAKAAPKTKKVE